MLTNPDSNRNIEELDDDEIYAAIRYLEPDSRGASKKRGDTSITGESDDNAVVISVCLCIALLGSIAIFWLYLR
jgi:hypothetical protein